MSSLPTHPGRKFTKWQHQLHLCQSRPANTQTDLYFWRSAPPKQGLFSHQNKGHLGSRYICIYIYFCTSMNKDMYICIQICVFTKHPCWWWNENTARFFPVVSSQCSFFQKHCWLQKINHSHEIDSPSSLSPILSIPEATCGGFSLSAMLSYLLPVFVNWRLTNGTK